jgi:hypothetical protein
MKDKQQLNQKRRWDVLSFFELRAISVLKPKDRLRNQPLGCAFKNV